MGNSVYALEDRDVSANCSVLYAVLSELDVLAKWMVELFSYICNGVKRATWVYYCPDCFDL